MNPILSAVLQHCDPELFAGGIFGGLLVEMARLGSRLTTGRAPENMGSHAVGSVMVVAVGGAFASLYKGQVTSFLAAVQLGAAAPAIIGAWATGKQLSAEAAAVVPQPEKPKPPTQPSPTRGLRAAPEDRNGMAPRPFRTGNGATPSGPHPTPISDGLRHLSHLRSRVAKSLSW
ncbi:MAG TPA: hypothetical protein VL588_12680 [Bdellovibrionota bacterium]|nr:hypothetical protein [Bdellovibrionota bacterium]